MKRITQGDKKKMVWLDMQHFPQYKIAQRVGTSQSTVNKWLRIMRETGEYGSFKRELQGAEPVTFDDERPAPEPEQPKMKNTGVNPDLERAVDDMIADAEPVSVAADEISANAEPDRLPKYIWAVLDDRISSINLEIETRKERIADLRDEIAALTEEHDKITAWMEAHA